VVATCQALVLRYGGFLFPATSPGVPSQMLFGKIHLLGIWGMLFGKNKVLHLPNNIGAVPAAQDPLTKL